MSRNTSAQTRGKAARTTVPVASRCGYRRVVAGRLKAGDRLVHHQPRKGRTFTAEVTADGHIRLDGGREFASPSPALRACVGSEINGWYQWTVERTGKPLQDYRYE